MYKVEIETKINDCWFVDHDLTQHFCDLDRACEYAFDHRDKETDATIYKELTTDQWNNRVCPVCQDGGCGTRSYRCGT